jgi:Activator of Hsp90 ATPase homolog 1-like protein
VRFRFADGSERRGRVEHVAPFRSLTWRWREHLGAGFGSRIGEPSVVTIELRRVTGGTRVRITERPASALAEASR